MKNIKKTSIVVLLILLIVCFFTLTSQAESAVPGSGGDPLVSRSYVDTRIEQVIALVNAKIAEVSGNTAGANINTDELKQEILNELLPHTGEAFIPVNVLGGQIILGSEGTEIILRSGRGVAYCSGENGLVNVTTGTELFNGYELQTNHLLLVPRNDGRGVQAATDAWFIIKGGYLIVTP